MPADKGQISNKDMQVIRLWKELRNVIEDINLGQITTQVARIRCEEMKSVEGIPQQGKWHEAKASR